MHAVATAFRPSPRHQAKRLVADRYRRIWSLVETIAADPGHSRRQLADRFHLSERQVQADLNIIRTDMHLPLVRRHGYRFVAEGQPAGSGALNLHEAQVLVAVLERARRDPSLPRARVGALLAKLPALFPPHLQPLVNLTLGTLERTHGPGPQRLFAALSDALLRGSWVQLHYPPGDLSRPLGTAEEPVVRPEVLLPCLGSWYLLAERRRPDGRVGAARMFRLDDVSAVTLQVEPEAEPTRSGRR